MFEFVTHFPCYPEWNGSLSRLNSKLFSMLIASAFGAAPHNPDKLDLQYHFKLHQAESINA